nr:hypothetical protein [Nitrospinaceae bacterium]NIR55126.1 hypothetical protein [Nitrospinaceae bacterium]NIS85546.1 hypothetical protein [Nitrospinaceae bacterium]NIT82380.1 hypothetical protein [Nitrospinaceae bacterium]NIU44593.1 hypothetical protein [Nitrospinaceae bacterium]
GRDLREVGLNHIEHAIQEGAPSTPLAMKTLAWFYIAEQINPDNEELSRNHPLSPEYARVRAHTLMDQFEKKFLRDLPGDLPGNKELEMMKAIQFVLDGHFRRAQKSFQKILDICDYLIQVKGMPLNPQLVDSVKEGIKFCDLMLLQPDPAREQEVRAACRKIHSQLEFLQSGGSMVEYDAKKIRSELHAVFAGALTGLSKKMDC